MKPQAAVLQLSFVALAVSGIAEAHILGFDTSGELVLTPVAGSSKTAACLKSCINHVARVNEGLCDDTTKIGCICSSPHPNIIRNQVVSCLQNCPSMEPRDVYLGTIVYDNICKSSLNKQNTPSGDMAIEGLSMDNVERHVRAGLDFNLAQLKQKRQEANSPSSEPPTPEPPTPEPPTPEPPTPEPPTPEPPTPEPPTPEPPTPEPPTPEPPTPEPPTPEPPTPEPPTPEPPTPEPPTPEPPTPEPPTPEPPTPEPPTPEPPTPEPPTPTPPTPPTPTPPTPKTPTPKTPTPKTPTPKTPTPGTPTPGISTPSREGGNTNTKSDKDKTTPTVSGGGTTGGRGTAGSSRTLSTTTTSRAGNTPAPVIPNTNSAIMMVPITMSALLIATSFVFIMSG